MHKIATPFRSCFIHLIRVFARSSSASVLLINRAPSHQSSSQGFYGPIGNAIAPFDGKWIINLPRTKTVHRGDIRTDLRFFGFGPQRRQEGVPDILLRRAQPADTFSHVDKVPTKQEMHNYLIKVSADHLLPARRSLCLVHHPQKVPLASLSRQGPHPRELGAVPCCVSLSLFALYFYYHIHRTSLSRRFQPFIYNKPCSHLTNRRGPLFGTVCYRIRKIRVFGGGGLS